MGSGYIYRCLKCKKKIELLEGTGFMDFSNFLFDYNNEFNLLTRYKNGINKSKLKEILKQKSHILEDNYEYKAYQCSNCKNISNEFYFRLLPLSSDDTEFVSEYKCHKCNTKLEILKNIDKCPFCGGEFDRENIKIIKWD